MHLDNYMLDTCVILRVIILHGMQFVGILRGVKVKPFYHATTMTRGAGGGGGGVSSLSFNQNYQSINQSLFIHEIVSFTWSS